MAAATHWCMNVAALLADSQVKCYLIEGLLVNMIEESEREWSNIDITLCVFSAPE